MKRAILRGLTALTAVAAALALAPGLAAGATPPELDFARYPAVNAKRYVSYNYDNNGRAFFRAGDYYCQIGQYPGRVACKGFVGTAPAGTQGVLLNNHQGPWWITPTGFAAPNMQLLPKAHFRAPILPVKRSISIYDVTCARPRAHVVSCTTRGRAFAISPKWHKFVGPGGYRNANPPSYKLPKSLR
ncbi:hypothetical protein GOARA_006_00300 [Gordonia araii NBRC 100433]|uniref:Uncharacterized protein n=1 Tax=Gordonia araii NBRC 100433 TaxID=1073574 RepID=G7GXE6_9ACTN|nr:hypothetical protein [Gordonia araii]NNG95943.1 hypothetical protein [Gordonia araii NBRC 100433]GAB08271.1 hypothetical protein GOARA_006_00300 [Gordonia araii NBRC 100433]